MDLYELTSKAHLAAREKGFHDQPREVGTSLMLIVSELGEALDADRKGRHADIAAFKKRYEELCNSINPATVQSEARREIKRNEFFKAQFESKIKDTYEDEIADTFIRLFDHCGEKGIDIMSHIELKMQYNALRPNRHGKAY